MQDIADRLGVSRSTVSLVLSGKAGSRVSEEVKNKVFQVAQELNYHINEVARSLRTGASKLIGVIVTASLVALAVLGTYVFVMNQGGLEGAEQKLRELLGKNKNGRKK